MSDLCPPLLRSLLFVPATRPDRYGKAVNSGPDVVCVDLEDAVPLSEKDEARSLVSPFFEEARSGSVLRALRINPLASEHGLKDMLLLLQMTRLPDVVLLPKVETAEEVEWFNRILETRPRRPSLIALIETARGMENAVSIAASPGVIALAFGTADYCAELGSDMSWDALAYGRGRLLQAAAQAGIDAIDGAWLNLDDQDGLLGETQRVAAMGFSGKPALHPKQLASIHQGLTPSESALAFALKVVEAFQEGAEGVLTVDGRMVDAPVVAKARKLVARAEKG